MTLLDAISICHVSNPDQTFVDALVKIAELRKPMPRMTAVEEEKIFESLYSELDREPTDEEMQEMANYYAAKAEAFAEASEDL